MNSSIISIFLISLVFCYSVAAIGSAFTIPSITLWYATLTKPWFTPPNWIFAPVWTILYTCMAIALTLIWTAKTRNAASRKARREGLVYFFIQLVLNVIWSILFFGAHQIGRAFLVLIALWLMIYLAIEKFHAIRKTAGYILFPYLAWVSFAAILNLSIVMLN